ncbi:hypothetical protein AMS68_006832 [Peltaster fructicola]|uniref:L-type lectin-like domain-containing protein n=1 Tax=Peltaster fructicola TaxID=286661 RepID=A0A6H0Y315_9PEZI|nr:hypothetical protein AMS68_006832 [Peltaster fructicola]
MTRPLSWLGTLLLATLAPSNAQDAANSDVNAIQLRTHSLQAPYLDSDMQSRWFDFGGSTIVRADQYIRLTGQQPSQSGWIFSRVPLTATNWEVEIEFNIHGTGSLWGDGMAIWFTKERGEQGPVFGMKDYFEGLGIFVDTYKNDRPGVVFPYVMAMLGDGKTKYDKDNDGRANELGGCSARGLRNAEIPTRMKITYFQDQNLVVNLGYKKENHWTNCFEVKDVKLPQVVFLGLSAETGELSDNHDIIKVETKNLYSPSGQKSSTPGPAGSKDYSRDKYTQAQTQKKAKGSWLLFFGQILLVILVAGAAYVGFTFYRAQRRDRF